MTQMEGLTILVDAARGLPETRHLTGALKWADNPINPMPTVNVATNLTAEMKPADWTDPRGALPGILDNPVKGFFRHVQLCGAGLVISHGSLAIFRIPLDELFKLAEAHEPKLCAPKPSLPNVAQASQSAVSQVSKPAGAPAAPAPSSVPSTPVPPIK